MNADEPKVAPGLARRSVQSRLQFLERFTDPRWYADGQEKSVSLRLYTSIGVPLERHAAIFEQAVGSVALDIPVKLTWLRMSGMPLDEYSMLVGADENGGWRLEVTPYTVSLPEGNYCVMAAPVHGSDTWKRFDSIAAALRCLGGRNFLFSVSHEGVHNFDGGSSGTQEIDRLPHRAEGPEVSPAMWQEASELFDSLSNLEGNERDRILLALRVFNDGFANDAFLSASTGLEILAGGHKTVEIAKQLSRCYGHRPKWVRKNTGLETIRRWRHNMIHDGTTVTASPSVLRLMQMLFLDLLRLRLGLSSKKHALVVLEQTGHDFSSLGLPDRRTREQVTSDENQQLSELTSAIRHNPPLKAQSA
jgi:hypothetical protein